MFYAEQLQGLLTSTYDIIANQLNGKLQNLHELLGDNLMEPPSNAGSLYFTVYNRGTFSFRTAGGELKERTKQIWWNKKQLCWWVGDPDEGFKPDLETDDGEFEVVNRN